MYAVHMVNAEYLPNLAQAGSREHVAREKLAWRPWMVNSSARDDGRV